MSTTTHSSADAAAELAVNGGTPIRPQPITWNIQIADETKRRIMQLLDTDEHLSLYYGGRHAREFEDAFAAYHGDGVKAVAVNSGTSAIHVALAAAGVGPGDEVIVPALCFVAAASTVVQLGAIPVICDAEPESLTLDTAMAASLITSRTKAVLPVHFWGYPSDLASLRELCDEHGLALIEDVCQSPGAAVGDSKAGLFGDYSAFSFSNRKAIHAGEGGAVLCRTQAEADRVRSIANYGKGDGWDDYLGLGYSYRMNEISALIARDGLARLDAENATRQRAAEIYRKALGGTGLTPVPDPRWGAGVYFKLPVMVPEDRLGQRDFIVDALVAEHISSRVPHRPLYEIGWLADFLREHDRFRGADECPVAAAAHPRLFEVETGPNLSPEEAEVSASAVLKVWRAIAGDER